MSLDMSNATLLEITCHGSNVDAVLSSIGTKQRKLNVPRNEISNNLTF